nr:von Willebrand factor A domain-containing protein 3B-like isoform X1 [Odocoileus virginianus texanus]XP_020761443.1 von Willebrand factor A domain-containing protein 3B-like isoform X1 [Odocoileus virginianus texanus]
MEVPGSSSTISEDQTRRQEELSDTRTDSVKQSLISSEEWLQLHGLKSNKLTLKQILSQIGFPHCEDYVMSLGRLVASRYANGLFPQIYTTEDGRVYNLTAKSELISQYMERLTQAVESCKQRMDWLTSNSRQIFGVILEQCIAIVLDLGGMLEEELSLCRDALTMVLQEQVAHAAKFNIIRVSQEPVKWQENAVPVTAPSIAAAISWVEKLSFELASSHTSCLDALLEAGKDEVIESIYYFVVGDVPEESKELLLQQALEIPCPVCTVSFNARGQGTIAFLKDLSAKTFSRSWGQRRCVSHLEGDGGSWQHTGPDPEAGGRDSQDQRGHNRPWWVLLTGASVKESLLSCNCYRLGIGTVSMFLTKEGSLVQLAGAPEGTLQSSVVCVSVYACTYVCLLVVKAKPEMDSQMVKKKQGSIQGLLQEGKRVLSMEVESVINKHEQVGICTQGAGWRVAGWKITEKKHQVSKGVSG